MTTYKTNDPASAEKLFAACRSWLSRGVSVMVFPEGKRSHEWRVQRFKRGAFELAAATQTQVLPIALAGTNDVSPPGTWRFCYRASRRVIIEALPPISPDGRTGEELRDECRRVLSRKVDELRRELWTAHRQGPAPAPG
jgi:1-acyl-sn-glycerol-3-phosphate acyltransferase